MAGSAVNVYFDKLVDTGLKVLVPQKRLAYSANWIADSSTQTGKSTILVWPDDFLAMDAKEQEEIIIEVLQRAFRLREDIDTKPTITAVVP